MLLDILVLLIIVGLTALCTAEGLARSAVMLVTFYLLCIIVGMLITGMNLAQLLGEAVIQSLGNAPRTPVFYQGLVFLVVLVPAWVIVVIVARMALEDATIKFLGWGDNLLGALTGLVLGLVFASVISNAWGVFVAERWQPDTTWLTLRVTFEGSALRPYMMDVMRLYQRWLFPFAGTGYPVFFTPQG